MRINPLVTERIAKMILWMSCATAVFILIFIIGFVLKNGLPVVNLHFLTDRIEDMGRSGGIFPTIISTVYLTFVAILIAVPLGVGSAIYLTEYTRPGRITRIIHFGAECLAGVPSIIFGLFGFIFFVLYLNFGWSILSGGLTLAAMILPTIIRTSEEAIKAVPKSFREVSFSLGGGRWQTVTRAVLPSSIPGILTGIVLSIGRSVGETAAVIFTAGSSVRVPASLFDPARTMSVHFYILAREGLSMENAYGTAAVLVISILLINSVAYWLMHRFIGRHAK